METVTKNETLKTQPPVCGRSVIIAGMVTLDTCSVLKNWVDFFLSCLYGHVENIPLATTAVLVMCTIENFSIFMNDFWNTAVFYVSTTIFQIYFCYYFFMFPFLFLSFTFSYRGNS